MLLKYILKYISQRLGIDGTLLLLMIQRNMLSLREGQKSFSNGYSYWINGSTEIEIGEKLNVSDYIANSSGTVESWYYFTNIYKWYLHKLWWSRAAWLYISRSLRSLLWSIANLSRRWPLWSFQELLFLLL